MTDSAHTLNDWRYLATPAGAAALRLADDLASQGHSGAALQQRLRAALSDTALVPPVLAQRELRQKAVPKFGIISGRLLFTPTGLEQASRAPVAELHAARLRQLGITRVFDLGCGLAAESLAFLRAGIAVVCVEIDELTHAFAQHNLAQQRLELGSAAPEAAALLVDATELPLAELLAAARQAGEVPAIFCDPARRTAGHRNARRVSTGDYSPDLDFVFGLNRLAPTLIKLGPGFARELLPAECAAEWVSVNGQAVETLLKCADTAADAYAAATPITAAATDWQPSTRTATVIGAHGTSQLAGPGDSPDPEVVRLGAYVFEPDPAVIRARQIGALALRLDAGLISPDIAYLTGDAWQLTPFAQCFRVLEQTPLRPKQLRRALTQRGATSVEVKKRGVDVDPAALRTQLRLPAAKGGAKLELTVIATRVAGAHTALICERVG